MDPTKSISVLIARGGVDLKQGWVCVLLLQRLGTDLVRNCGTHIPLTLSSVVHVVGNFLCPLFVKASLEAVEVAV